MQSVYLILKKHNKYKDLELGTYHHFADNIHFYERHFELAKKIKSEDDALESNINTLILKKPLVDYNGKDVFVTDEGMEFTRRLDQTQGSKEVNYKNILKDYFTL
jgi:thymidylate synthase